MHYRYNNITVCICLFLLILFFLLCSWCIQYAKTVTKCDLSDKPTMLKLHMADLWVQHLIYTRLYFMSYFRDSPELQVVRDKLLENQQNIGHLFGSKYGIEKGQRLAELLTVHIKIAVSLLTAIKEGNDTEKNVQLKNFYDNAAQVGDFIDNARGGGNYFKQMMKMHIDTLVNCILAFVGSNWTQDLKIY